MINTTSDAVLKGSGDSDDLISEVLAASLSAATFAGRRWAKRHALQVGDWHTGQDIVSKQHGLRPTSTTPSSLTHVMTRIHVPRT
jgi:hypothetical protein